MLFRSSTYLHFCCPQCEYKNKQEVLFRLHMKENHSAKNVMRRTIDAKEIIARFLRNNHGSFKSDLVFHGNNVEVIKNPPLQLPGSENVNDTEFPKEHPKVEQKCSVSIFRSGEVEENQGSDQEHWSDRPSPDPIDDLTSDPSMSHLNNWKPVIKHWKKHKTKSY